MGNTPRLSSCHVKAFCVLAVTKCFVSVSKRFVCLMPALWIWNGLAFISNGRQTWPKRWDKAAITVSCYVGRVKLIVMKKKKHSRICLVNKKRTRRISTPTDAPNMFAARDEKTWQSDRREKKKTPLCTFSAGNDPFCTLLGYLLICGTVNESESYLWPTRHFGIWV